MCFSPTESLKALIESGLVDTKKDLVSQIIGNHEISASRSPKKDDGCPFGGDDEVEATHTPPQAAQVERYRYFRLSSLYIHCFWLIFSRYNFEILTASQETEFKEYKAFIARQENTLPRLRMEKTIIEDDQPHDISIDLLNYDSSFRDDEVLFSTKTNEHSHQESNDETANSTTSTQHVQKRYVLGARRIYCNMPTKHFFIEL